MKEPNPLVPQGSFEAHARSKSQVRLAVFTILTIHVVVLGALLIHGAGCKREDNKDAAASAQTNAPAADYSSTPPLGSNDVVTPLAPSNATGPGGAAPVLPLPPTNPVVAAPTPTPVTPSPAATLTESSGPVDYTIVKGDTFSGLATKNGTTVKALKAANPGVDPAKLKLGQKIKIPGKTAPAGASGSTTTAAPAAESSDSYVIRAGDTLGKIAKEHGTTAKAIQRLNNLTTTQIRVGQKLKLPPRTLPASKATPTPAAPGGTAPLTVPPPLPAPAQ